LNTLRNRLRNEEKGFTLIEIILVMIILPILTAVAVPSYLGFKDRANKSAAVADVRSVIPSVESYFADKGTYTGMTIAGLKATYDQALDPSTYTIPAASLSSTSYCVQAKSQNKTAFKNGPSAQVGTGLCP
jgi:type IV pilus assembly protein PilA